MFRPVFIVNENVKGIVWIYLTENPNAVHILEQNLHILEKNLNRVIWEELSANPNAIAIHLLEQNLDKVDWRYLSLNPNAIYILEKNLDKVNWRYLSLNPNAIHLLAKLDANAMREKCKTFAEELARAVFNPIRAQRMADQYDLDMDEYLELL